MVGRCDIYTIVVVLSDCGLVSRGIGRVDLGGVIYYILLWLFCPIVDLCPEGSGECDQISYRVGIKYRGTCHLVWGGIKYRVTYQISRYLSLSL